MSLTLGARRMIELTQALETMAQAGKLEGAAAVLQDLQIAFHQTKARLLPLRTAAAL
jgi:hypothetical protein